MLKIASYNVENLFARPKAFDLDSMAAGEDILKAYREVNQLMQSSTYTPEIKQDMKDRLIKLDVYHVLNGAVRRHQTKSPRWAWLRKNRGSFDREPTDKTKDVVIDAAGRDDWIGWVELATEPVNQVATRMTAEVIKEVNADVMAIIEAEDRPSLLRFNRELMQDRYRHVMLVEGNDERGIDVAIMTQDGFEIKTIRSNVDARDDVGIVFSRDCPEYEVQTPAGTTIYFLVNHFKSQSGGGDSQRKRQAAEVRRIVNRLVAEGKDVVVLGDFNEGPKTVAGEPENFAALYDNDSPLLNCYKLDGFDVGPRQGTFDACGIRERIDYILISKSLETKFRGGGIFRKGLWGSRKTRPTAWVTYPEMKQSNEGASDHAAIFINLDV